MENGVSAMSNAEILAGATRKEAEIDHGKSLAVGYFWPDGFKFGSRDAANAERDATRARREWLTQEAARGS